MIDSKISNPKGGNKAQDYFKTFYTKPSNTNTTNTNSSNINSTNLNNYNIQNKPKTSEKSLRSMMPSNNPNILFNSNNENSNPFVTLNQPTTNSLVSSTL